MVAEYRQQHAPGYVFAHDVPVDIEVAGKPRCRPVFKYIEPPVIVGAADKHVVRHHVQDLAHSAPFQRVGERLDPSRVATSGLRLLWSVIS